MTQAATQHAHAAALAELPVLLERCGRPGVPKYLVLRDAVVQAVTSRRLAGRHAPAQRGRSWPRILPLSLGTIQRALRLLVEDGVIRAPPGPGLASSPAAAPKGRMHAPLHCRFLDDAGGYLPVYPEVTDRYAVDAPGPWSAHLGAPGLVCIERRLRIADEFSVFSRFYADPRRMPAFATLPARKLNPARISRTSSFAPAARRSRRWTCSCASNRRPRRLPRRWGSSPGSFASRCAPWLSWAMAILCTTSRFSSRPMSASCTWCQTAARQVTLPEVL
jgi:hypothetical protein